MYFASKIFYFFVQPSHFALFLIGLGIALLFWSRAARFGKVLAGFGLVLLLVLGFSPLGHALLLPLEERFPRGALPQDVTGIIILGGFEDGRVSRARGALTVNESAERLTEALVLAHQLPNMKVVFTGGTTDILQRGHSGAPMVGAFLEAAGIHPQRIVLEGRSLTTYQNATFTRARVTPKPGERWLLVTSAWHMPRAIGTFRKAGFDVVPWPVDYRTRGAAELVKPFGSVTEGLRRTDMATREWLGLLAYWLLGQSNALWPAPDRSAP